MALSWFHWRCHAGALFLPTAAVGLVLELGRTGLIGRLSRHLATIVRGALQR